MCVGKKFDSELKEWRMIQKVPSSWGYIFVATGLRKHGGQGPKNQLLMIVKTKGLAIRGSEKLVNVAREGELDRGLTRWHGPPETHLDVVCVGEAAGTRAGKLPAVCWVAEAVSETLCVHGTKRNVMKELIHVPNPARPFFRGCCCTGVQR